MDKQKNIPLIVGLSVPILMILFVAGSIYLPRWFTKVRPQVNFLYSTGGYWGSDNFIIRDGKIQKVEEKSKSPYPPYTTQDQLRLFVHDMTKNESKEISFEAAQALQLNSNTVSQDGFEVVHGRGMHLRGCSRKKRCSGRLNTVAPNDLTSLPIASAFPKFFMALEGLSFSWELPS